MKVEPLGREKSSLSDSKPKTLPLAELCCLTLPRKNRSKDACSLWATVNFYPTENERLIKSKMVIEFSFSSYAGSEVTVDDEELLIMSEDDILAILD